MIVPLINAIPAWEGYEYQGHMALCVVLEKIKQLKENGEDIALYELQIEDVEDFSIRRDGKYVSMHQVKQGKVDLKSADKFSFIIGMLQNNVQHGYFHVNTRERIPTNFVEQTIVYAEELLLDLNKPIVNKAEIEGVEQNYIIIENIKFNSPKASVEKMIHLNCPEKDKTKIEDAIKSIVVELQQYVEQIKEKRREMASELIDICYVEEYNSKFDTVKEIKDKSYQIIKELLTFFNPVWSHFLDDTYLSFVYNQVLVLMKDRITEYHEKHEMGERCTLKFEEILSLMQRDLHVQIDSPEYQYYKVLDCVREMFINYPQHNLSDCTETNCEVCSKNSMCNLYKQICILDNKEIKDKEQIIRNLILKEPMRGEMFDLPDRNLVNRLLLNLLHKINKLQIEENNIIQAIRDNGEVYRLSLDSSGEICELQEKIEAQVKNNVDKILIFESDVLITDQLNQEAFRYNGVNVNVLEEEQLRELNGISSDSIEKMRKDCTKPKIIRVVNRNQAKGDLI